MSLVFRFTVPTGNGNHLTFREWLPLKSEDALTVTEAGLRLRLWIDKGCLGHIREVDLDNIGSYSNIFIRKIYVDIEGLTVSDPLMDIIPKLAFEKNWTKEHMSATYAPTLIAEYNSIGERIYSTIIRRFNRLISYARAVKGQYWLQEYQPDADNIYSELVKLDAKVKVRDGDWVPLMASPKINLTVSLPSKDRLIGQDDWERVREYVVGEQKAPLVGQLLAAADQFNELEERRASLTEAVSALEIAINQFAQRAKPENWTALLAGRCSATQFQNHVNRLGTTCTVGYLFPVIFSEEQISGAVLKTCQDAINERNTVIHRGQRDVDQQKLRDYLHAIRELCERLLRFQSGA